MKFKWKLAGLVVIGTAIVSAIAFVVYVPEIKNLTDSSPVITEERNINGYNKINFSGIGELEIVQTGTEGIQISAAENILPDIETNVSNNTLTIRYKWSWRKNSLKNQRPVKIQVQVADLSKIIISGAGTVSSPGLKTANLELSLSGASQVNLNIEVDSLKSEITGAGQMTLAGVARNQKINISGVGKYIAQSLSGNDADVIISGLGSAEVAVNNTLNIVISGGGKVSYSGKPKVTKQISGLGSIIKE